MAIPLMLKKTSITVMPGFSSTQIVTWFPRVTERAKFCHRWPQCWKNWIIYSCHQNFRTDLHDFQLLSMSYLLLKLAPPFPCPRSCPLLSFWICFNDDLTTVLTFSTYSSVFTVIGRPGHYFPHPVFVLTTSYAIQAHSLLVGHLLHMPSATNWTFQ